MKNNPVVILRTEILEEITDFLKMPLIQTDIRKIIVRVACIYSYEYVIENFTSGTTSDSDEFSFEFIKYLQKKLHIFSTNSSR